VRERERHESFAEAWFVGEERTAGVFDDRTHPNKGVALMRAKSDRTDLDFATAVVAKRGAGDCVENAC
jgi:hypothetical protein